MNFAEELRNEIETAFEWRPYPGDEKLTSRGCPGSEDEDARDFFVLALQPGQSFAGMQPLSRKPIIALLAAAALLIAGNLITVEAQDEGCFEGNPLMTCPLAECITLEAAVKTSDSCSTQANPLSGCNKITGCFNLRQARARWLKCYQTRVILMQRCFSGGDFEHQEKAAIAIEKVFECDVKIRQPSPDGCDDPC